MIFDVCLFLKKKNVVEIKVSLKSELNNGHIFCIVSRSVLLRMRTVTDKRCRGNKNTHFVFNNFFFKENRTFYDIMWKK
jgi:hypothetical protein